MTSKLKDPLKKETIKITNLSEKKGDPNQASLILSPLEKEQLIERFKKVYEEQFHNLNIMNSMIMQSNIKNFVNNLATDGDSTGRTGASGLNIEQIKQLLNEEVIMRENWKPELSGRGNSKIVKI